jgi:histidinol-phosphate/aromatic aminotransferase/cobyric acid decarboxylase-like protein
VTLPPPGAHGGDGAALAAALGLPPDAVLDLSASLNPCAPDVAALAAGRLDALRRYPDPAAATGALADAMGVEAERVLLTNGGAEAIALLSAEVGGTVAAEPEFALHPRGEGGPIWRSDPHNPSGRLASAADRADVWDEAFYPLATGCWGAGGRPVVVGSLTKVFACPGLRLGYVVAEDPALVAAVGGRQPHWAVNGLAAALLPGLLAGADLPGWRDRIAGLRSELVGLLAAHGLAPQPSDAPWVLCADAAGLRQRLATCGVLVRDCTSFGMPGAARVAVPDDAGLARLARALEATA